MNRTTTTIRISQEHLDKLDHYANKMGLSRNQLMVNMMSIAIDDLALLDKLGILSLGAGLRDLISMARNPDDMNAIDTERG